jgi:molybdenum cofactor biosynthesis enzyme MoaA
MNEQIIKLKNELSSKIENGIEGNASVPINDLQILLTNKCNLYCTMCHSCFPEYENRTYDNTPPFELSLDQYKKLFNVSFTDRLKVFFLNSDIIKKKAPKEVLFSSAESLLNRNIYEIIRYTKKIFPETSIRLISNGTIPLVKENRDIVKLIRKISFSVDGCTAETFEKIRTPAKFEHVINNIKGFIKAKNEFGSKMSIELAIVLSSINAHELPGIVKLAGRLGGIESLWVQPMIITHPTPHPSLEQLKQFVFSKMDRELLAKYISEALAESKSNGIRITITPSILDYAFPKQEEGIAKTKIDYTSFTPACNYLWNGNLQIDGKGIIRSVCCYMSQKGNIEIMKKYGLYREIEDYFSFYNSQDYWMLRKDFLDGKCMEYCKSCPIGYTSIAH